MFFIETRHDCGHKAVPCLYIIVVVIFAVICRDKALPCLMMQTTNRKMSEQDYGDFRIYTLVVGKILCIF